MKKLVVVAAVALAAACSQAASVSWNLTGTASDVGLKAYVVETLSEFASESDIQTAALGTSGNSATFAGARTGSSAQGTVRGLDDSKSGQTQNFYYVIVSSDGKGYWSSGVQSAEIYTTATTHQDSKVAASTFMTGNYTAWSTGGGGGGSGGGPEPTAGLLRRVGGAMLALRRKQK